MERKMLLGFGLVAAGLLLSGCATTTDNGISVKYATDNLQDRIIVSSELYDQPFTGYPSPSDYFFAASIDKRSGEKFYQINLLVNSEDWRRWDQLQFRKNGEPVTLPIAWQGTDMTCTDYGCAHTEYGVASLDEPTLEYIAGQDRPVEVRMGSSRVDSHLDVQLYPDEARAFLTKTSRLPM
ncbi:hypothetical protein EZI54_19610 [Marinobacter halodurans]|uniref:Lipoprotein n=1 Tax=Marinobacter halodurans TaxID=2528979 RepID=A0ABY1ZHU4_9GAMM|nr:hypothetical protein [Marinobacter halodurans]TBW49524.1 hypothetical protein EZI54_19610 [Marinobacter halodurans]